MSSASSSLVRACSVTAGFLLMVCVTVVASAAPGDALLVNSPGVTPDATPVEGHDGDVALKTGAFQYNVPIVVPPGRLGVEPQLALSYSSHAGLRGGVAAGWSLGLPEIRRDFSEGVLGPVAWSSSLHGGHALIAVVEPALPGVPAYRGEGDETFTRYRHVVDGSGYWEARTLDGRVFRFGESEQIEGQPDPDRFPLTSISDVHGNTISYHWKRFELLNSFYTILPQTIRYSSNAAAGILHHAEVRFQWTEAAACFAALLPIGARWDNRNDSRHVDGGRTLTKIETFVRDTPAAAFRVVRTIDLEYLNGSCSSHAAPVRNLQSIRESGLALDGFLTSLPPLTFTYGDAEQPPAIPLSMPGIPSTLSSGSSAHPSSPPFLTSKMIDLDGDGRMDRLTASSSLNSCNVSWHRNVGDRFAAPVTIALPQELPWRNGSTPQIAYHELCSLAGQESALETPGIPQPKGQHCPHRTAWVAYRWLDVTGDGLPDLVTALSYNPLWYDPSIGATPTNSPPSTRNRNCTQGEARNWQEVSGAFPWRVYPNLGNGQFATQPLDRALPFALDGEGVDGFIGKKERDLTLQQHVRDYGIIDMDGDGRLDLIQATVSSGWLVHKGLQNAQWSPPVAWSAPAGAMLSSSITTWPTTTWSHTDTNEQLEDVNGDGLPDLLRTGPSGILAHFNTGRSFASTPTTIALLPAEHAPGRTVIQALQGSSGSLQHGRRYTVHRFVDIDGDGLSEFVRNEGGHNLTPYVHPNHGGSFHMGLPGPLVPSADVLFSRAEDDGNWTFDAELLDVTGDGVPDAYQDGNLFTRLGGTPRHLLRLVDNGRGGEVRINYSTSSNPTVGEIGSLRRGGPVWVVDRITRVSGSTSVPTGVTQYAYEHPAAVADRQGQTAFRGFRKVIVTSPLGARTEHSFTFEHIDVVQGNVLWEGAAEKEELFDGNGVPVSSTTHSYTVLPVLGGSTYAVAPDLVEFMTWIPGAGPGQGIDSPLERTSTNWSPVTESGSGQIIAYYEQSRETRVEDNGPTPLVVQDRRSSSEARLLYAQDAYTLLSDIERQEEFDGTVWATTAEVKRDFGGVLPIAEHALIEPGVYATTKRQFRPSGVVFSTIRPRHTHLGTGLAILTDYDVFEIHPTRTTDELGGYVHRRFDLGTGALTLESARTDQTVVGFAPRIEMEFDGVGRPRFVRRTHFDGTALVLAEIERITYVDNSDSLEIRERLLSFESAQWSREDSHFDGWGNVVSKVNHTIRGPEASSFTFDTAGNVVSVETLDVRDDSTQTITFQYLRDSLGRVMTRVSPELAPTEITYVGRDVTESVTPSDGSLGRHVKHIYDPRGRLRRIEELATSGWAVTTYDYDGNDNVERIVNADGAETLMTHDGLGRRTRVERNDRVWTFWYDRHGNLETEQGPVPPGGNAIDYANTYTYDAIDRQTTSRPGLGNLNGASAVTVATHGTTIFTYDQQCSGSFGFGRLCKVTVPFGGMTYGYTAEGWMSSETRSFTINLSGEILQINEVADYVHDPDGEAHEITHTDAQTASWRLDYIGDADGLPFRVDAGRVGDPFTTIATVQRGRGNVVRSRSGPAGQSQSWSYDALGRVKIMGVSTTAGMVVQQSLTYWQTGNVRTLGSSTLGGPFEYHYDPQYQITGVGGGQTDYLAAFSYSPAGRVTRAMVSSTLPGAQVTSRDVMYHYASASAPTHQLSNVSNGAPLVTMTHDEAGNTIRRTKGGVDNDYRYDAFDRLREAQVGTACEVHLYLPDGGRALTLRNDGGWTARHWFGPAETLYAANGTQLEADMHIGLGAMTVARLERSPESSPELVYVDGLGNTLALLDANGTSTGAFAYGAFGETLVASGPSAQNYHRRFNGEEWDEVTGLVYYGFRYYDPLVLQWTQPDPMYRVSPDQDLSNPRLAGLYDFSLNNPLRYVDPNGLEPLAQAMADLQKEMCTDSTQHPSLCPKGPSNFWYTAWAEKYTDEFEPEAEEAESEPEKRSSPGFLGQVAGVLIAYAVPESAEEAALMAAAGPIGKAVGKVVVRSKRAAKATVRGAKGTKKARKAHRASRADDRIVYHHLTPQKFRAQFRRLGVNEHDMTIPIRESVHKRIHSPRQMARIGKLEWNARWQQEFDSGRLADKASVRRFALKMRREYGLPNATIVRYPNR